MKRALLTAAAAVALIGGLTAITAPSGAAPETVTTKSGVVTHGSITTTEQTIGWLLTCPVSHSLPDDPITAPGRPGAAHLHDFTGNASTSAASTLASMEDPANRVAKANYTGSTVQPGTSCNLPAMTPGTAGDTAAYWRPALYVNGKKITPTVKDQLYYRAKPLSGTDYVPIPHDARLIVGTASATSIAGNKALVDGHIYWEDANGKKSQTAPSTSSFLLNVVFPSCWDGQPMDHSDTNGTDNKHFAYAVSGSCPAGFPTKMAQLSEKFKYDNVPSGTRELASMANMDTMRGPTYTAHADFWNTWDPTALKFLTDRCINAQLSCGTNPITPLGTPAPVPTPTKTTAAPAPTPTKTTAAPTPTPTKTTAAPTPTPTKTTTAPTTSPGSPVRAPSDVLDLSRWRLALPIDTAHAGDPDTIGQPELTGFRDPSFRVDSSGTEVVFGVTAGGYTRSSLAYAQTQLREMADVGGRNKAAWSSRSGTHALALAGSIDAIPAGSGVVIATIESADEQILRIELSGGQLRASWADGSRTAILSSSFALGSEFDVRLSATASGIAVWSAGALVATAPVTGTGWYFTAGAALLTNVHDGSPAGAAGQVSLSRLLVLHS